MQRRTGKIMSLVSKILYVGSGVAIGFMAVLVTYASLARYLFGRPIAMTEELSGFLLVVCVFLALPYVALEDRHIRFNLIITKLPPRAQACLKIATYSVILFYLSIFTKFAFDFSLTAYRLGCRSESARLLELPWRITMFVAVAWFAALVLVLCINEAWNLVALKRASENERAKRG